jgi:hypothetical protein
MAGDLQKYSLEFTDIFSPSVAFHSFSPWNAVKTKLSIHGRKMRATVLSM